MSRQRPRVDGAETQDRTAHQQLSLAAAGPDSNPTPWSASVTATISIDGDLQATRPISGDFPYTTKRHLTLVIFFYQCRLDARSRHDAVDDRKAAKWLGCHHREAGDWSCARKAREIVG